MQRNLLRAAFHVFIIALVGACSGAVADPPRSQSAPTGAAPTLTWASFARG